jgi:hypothetical protein
MQIAIRPFLQREKSTVIFAVKLRIAYSNMNDKDFDATDIEKLTALTMATKMPIAAWLSTDARRVSMIHGTGHVAKLDQKAEFVKACPPQKIAKQLFSDLEKLTGRKLDNKMQVINALTEYFSIQTDSCFYAESKVPEPPQHQIGKINYIVPQPDSSPTSKNKD